MFFSAAKTFGRRCIQEQQRHPVLTRETRLTSVHAAMNTRHFKAGEVIFQEGEISHEAFFLISGTVEISIKSGDGSVVLGRLGPGEIFGEMGMITDRPRSATARALENTVVESINEAEFELAILAQPERMHAYLATLFDRIRATDLLLQMEWHRQQTASGQRPTPAAARREREALHGSVSFSRTSSSAMKQRIHLQAAEGNPAAISVDVTALPFRIGRAYADTNAALFARNDLSIPDSQPYHVSRNHCEIDLGEQGLVIRDRGSRLGTIVNNVAIGAHSETLSAPLHQGDNMLLLGSDDSPFRIVVKVENL